MSGNENLNNENLDATITVSNASAAEAGTSEDTAQGKGNAYQSTIDDQANTIDALIAANKRLQQQMQQILRNGGIINDSANADSGNADSGINPPEATTPEQIMSAPDYEPLSALGKNIGKKPTRE